MPIYLAAPGDAHPKVMVTTCVSLSETRRRLLAT
jgi:hypothetical protein